MNLTAKHILVKGKVQGVFFRKNTKQVADAFNITGWVKNTDDGDVEIFAQADEAAVEALIAWCRKGPPKAEVSGVDVTDAKPDKDITRFLVEH